MLTITFTIECHCGEIAEASTTYLDIAPGDPIRVDAELAVSQRDFACPACFCVTGSFDLGMEVAEKGPDCEGE